ncbi:four-carbon acid sugar kinase family protein [Halomonas sp. SpR8]|uniref:four-carbon acid sugar kinase family protein n=1 Tax=Halomonas sp. SpR8 TaxID=3050463 RepID=UPI0027E5126C|nr:four-carbon acid sugar kinase family protein [Halomonas sp. SpR8]MDQ7730410.1 four-carbon acid sugar kinase family protein [Halomonas sp. SpR8]
MSTPLLLSYYGDDLTGSTDVMEALSLHGIKTVLFLAPQSEEKLAPFADYSAIGLAGTSRSESPEWMETHLNNALVWLKSLNASLCHYKVCSTFDSAPNIGNIGKALEIGKALFAQRCVPLVVGAPQLKRYTVFGQHFAAFDGEVHRIDRHPVMSRHPVTPMAEADLRRHLAKQTQLVIGLADLLCLEAANTDTQVDQLSHANDVMLYDTLNRNHQASVGEQLWRTRLPDGSFVVGSSAVEYALVDTWRKQALIPKSAPLFSSPGAVEQIAVVSGSCSEVTARQIRFAEAIGFRAIAIDVVKLIDERTHANTLHQVLKEAIEALNQGESVIVYTAMGPNSDADAVHQGGEKARHLIGRSLGQLLRQMVEAHGLKRIVIAGGDTSSHALSQLGVHALTTRLPLPETPGSPLCIAHSDQPALNGLEVALKGGQIGSESYFISIRDGVA